MDNQIRVKVTNLLPRNRTYTLSNGSSIRLQSGGSTVILTEHVSSELERASKRQEVLLQEICIEEETQKSTRKRSEK